MANLYFGLLSSGGASYISAHKAGIVGTKLHAHLAYLVTRQIVSGPDKGRPIAELNPRCKVPVLVLEDGTTLSEGAAILQWIADQNPAAELAPPWGTSERYLLQAKLNYIASELHPCVMNYFGSDFFGLKPSPEVKEYSKDKYLKELRFLAENDLADGRTFLLGGSAFTVADAYLYRVITMSVWLGEDLAGLPVICAYRDRLAALDFVKDAEAAMQALLAANSEHLAKKPEAA